MPPAPLKSDLLPVPARHGRRLGDARALEGRDDQRRHRVAIHGHQSDVVLDRRVRQRDGRDVGDRADHFEEVFGDEY